MAQENTKILSAPKGSSKKKHRVGRGSGQSFPHQSPALL